VTSPPVRPPSPPHRRPRLVAAALLLAALAAPAASAAVAGRVVSATGQPVEQARVSLEEGDRHVFTDARGGFRLPEVEPPVTLHVAHARFRPVDARVEGDEAVEIVLEAKQEIYEAIVVTASRSPQGESTPPTLAASTLQPDDLPTAPATLTETVRAVPGVAENGQGGIFQVFSIRGVSRQRVLTLVSGMHVTSERRAGASTSFLDPLLIGDVEVVRGPASTWYGSGALGGVVELFPRRYHRAEVEAGWASPGDERWVAAGWGDGASSVAVAHRGADDAETADGEPLFSRFERTVASLARSWGGDERLWELTLLPSLTTGIGKPNTEYPQVRTLYPREEHLMARLSVLDAGGFRGYVWAHPSTLETEVTDAAGRELVANETFDFGLDLQHELELSRRLSGRLGVEYFGRRGVDALERRFDAAGDLVSASRTLADAEQDETAAFGSVAWRLPGATLSAGSRFTWQRQDNAGAAATDDTAWNGFVGAAVPLPAGFQITANLGTGLRFPTLSERFFTGTTGRGEIVANPDLDPERSINGDLGLAWFGDRLFLRGHLFRNEIDEYIERITLPSGARTFVNLVSGTLEGVELEGSWQPVDGWTLGLGGHRIDGEDDGGAPLADVPPDRVHLTLAAGPRAGLAGGRLGFLVRAEQRDDVDTPGDGEKAIPSALLLDASATWRLSGRLDLTLRGTNLTDETYFPSADELAVPAPGRGFGLALAWTGG
jgi:outer membrane receptor protein involved in Fe transport